MEEELFELTESLSPIYPELSETKTRLRLEMGKIIAMDRLDSAEATRIFVFLGIYSYQKPEKQQVHKKLSEWITDWLFSWSSRFGDMSNCPHTFLYRASMACMVLSQFYSWKEQDAIYLELEGKQFPDCRG